MSSAIAASIVSIGIRRGGTVTASSSKKLPRWRRHHRHRRWGGAGGGAPLSSSSTSSLSSSSSSSSSNDFFFSSSVPSSRRRSRTTNGRRIDIDERLLIPTRQRHLRFRCLSSSASPTTTTEEDDEGDDNDDDDELNILWSSSSCFADDDDDDNDDDDDGNGENGSSNSSDSGESSDVDAALGVDSPKLSSSSFSSSGDDGDVNGGWNHQRHMATTGSSDHPKPNAILSDVTKSSSPYDSSSSASLDEASASPPRRTPSSSFGKRDDDGNGSAGSSGGGNVSDAYALRAAIESLKGSLSSSSSSTLSSSSPPPPPNVAVSSGSPLAVEENALLLESSSPTSLPDLLQTNGDGIATTATRDDDSDDKVASSKTTKPSLADLLQTDIFAKSWSESDDNGGGGDGGNGGSQTSSSSSARATEYYGRRKGERNDDRYSTTGSNGNGNGNGNGTGNFGTRSPRRDPPYRTGYGRGGGDDYHSTGDGSGSGEMGNFDMRSRREDVHPATGYGRDIDDISTDGSGGMGNFGDGRSSQRHPRRGTGYERGGDDNYSADDGGGGMGYVGGRSHQTGTPPRTGYSRGSDDHSIGGGTGNVDERSSPMDPPSVPSTSLSDLLASSSPPPPVSKKFDETSPSWGDDDSSGFGHQPREPSPIEMEYDKILEQTDELLNSLSKDDDSSTLQLMDFDNVMTRWSRFHSEVDGVENDRSRAAADRYGIGGGDGENESLKRKASEQCLRLLEALEDNYDRALHAALPPSAASSYGEDVVMPRTTGHSKLMPNAASYNLALHALAHSGRGGHTAQEACSILTRMLDRCTKYLDIMENNNDDEGMDAAKLPPPPFEPTIITYNSVLHAVAKSRATDAGHLAEEVYKEMYRWRDRCLERRAKHDQGSGGSGDATMGDGEPAPTPMNYYSPNNKRTMFYRGVTPNARTLACVLDAWANTKTTLQQSFAPERAEAILDLAVRRRRTYVEAVTGKVGHVENLDGSLDSSGHEEEDKLLTGGDDVLEEVVDEELLLTDLEPAPSQSEEEMLSPKMGNMPESNIPAVRPNTVAFNTCINAWATSSRGREGALRSQELLNRLEAISESGELDLPSGKFHEFDDDDSPDADSLLRPNVRSYSMVMNAWANVTRLEGGSGKGAASHCEDILNKMERRGVVDMSVRPNLVAYVTAISAWARVSQVDHAASRAENILNRMIDLYYGDDEADLPILDGDVENASHDAPFNAVITAYARSSDPYSADRALAVLQRLEASPIPPTATSYNAAMDVCAKHGQPQRALEILDRMKEMSVAHDSTSYDTVLNAFARDEREGSAERAYEFLCQLEDECSLGETNFTPSSTSYATVINAFARASGKEFGGIHTVKKAKQIYEKLIDQMSEGTIQGVADPFANSCFLNCCANVRGRGSDKKEALIYAISAFEDMKKRTDLIGEPNHYTFGTMMKVSNRLSSDAAEKHRLMESIFVQACKKGCLSRAVLGQFLRNTPSHFNMKVIISLGGTKREIPESWHRNVTRKHWPTLVTNNNNNY